MHALTFLFNLNAAIREKNVGAVHHTCYDFNEETKDTFNKLADSFHPMHRHMKTLSKALLTAIAQNYDFLRSLQEHDSIHIPQLWSKSFLIMFNFCTNGMSPFQKTVA